MIFILIFRENYLQNDAIHDFSVCLRNGVNLVDINRFPSHNGKNIFKFILKIGSTKR